MITANTNGTFNFQRFNIEQNGIVQHPLQKLQLVATPWYYTSPLSPGNTPSYLHPVLYSQPSPYVVIKPNGF